MSFNLLIKIIFRNNNNWTNTRFIIIVIVVVVEVTITIYVPYIVSIIGRTGPNSNEAQITRGSNLADLSQYYLL